jgi:hypothetical protein
MTVSPKKENSGIPVDRGPGYNENAVAMGAQTERPDDDGPVRDVAWRHNLTGRFVDFGQFPRCGCAAAG